MGECSKERHHPLAILLRPVEKMAPQVMVRLYSRVLSDQESL